MKHWIVRITELVVFDKGEQELESLVIMEAEDEAGLATQISERIMQMKEINLYADDVEHVHVGTKEMTDDEWKLAAKFINTYAMTCCTEDGEPVQVEPGVQVSDTVQ